MKRPIPKDETRDFKSNQNDLFHLAAVYGNYRSCIGYRQVHTNYCCAHCGSTDPGGECYAPNPEQKKYLVQKGDAWVRKPVEEKCRICRKVMSDDTPPDVNCGGDCRQCMAEAGDPDAIKALVKWTRSIT